MDYVFVKTLTSLSGWVYIVRDNYKSRDKNIAPETILLILVMPITHSAKGLIAFRAIISH